LSLNSISPTVLIRDREIFPISALSQTQMYNHTKLYATDLVDLEYCPRLFYMKKTMKIPRTETFAMLRGTIEHEVRRTTIKSLKEEYKSCDNLPLLKNLDYKLSIQNATFDVFISNILLISNKWYM